MKKMFLILLFTVSTASVAFTQGVNFFSQESWSKVLEQARKEGKPIFVDCYTSWCGPCKMLAKNVFPLKEVGDFYNTNFVCAKYDVEKGEGIEFKKLYNDYIDGYPTLIIINQLDGKVIHLFSGLRTPEGLIAEGKMALAGGLDLLKNQYDRGFRDEDFIRLYIESLHNATKQKDIVQVIDEHLSSVSFEKLYDENYWSFYSRFLYDAKSKFFNWCVKNYTKLNVQYNQKEGEKLINRLGKVIELSAKDLGCPDKDSSTDSVSMIYNDSTYQMLMNQAEVLKKFNDRSSVIAWLNVYDNIRNKQWDELYSTLSAMKEFQIIQKNDFSHILVYCFVIKNIDNKELKLKMINDALLCQKEGANYMAHYNIYDLISILQKATGDLNASDNSLLMYNKLKTEREMKFNKSQNNK